MARLRQGAGVMMLAAVASNASGMTSALKSANGIADQLENALLSPCATILHAGETATSR